MTPSYNSARPGVCMGMGKRITKGAPLQMGINFRLHYGWDFGVSPGTPLSLAAPDRAALLDTEFALLAAAGCRIVRWFVFCDGRNGIRFLGERPAGLDPLVAPALRVALDTAFGRLTGRRGQGAVPGTAGTLFIRPESLRVAIQGTPAALQAELVSSAFEGNTTHLFLRTADGLKLTMTAGPREAASLPGPGAQLALTYDPAEAIVLGAPGTAA